MIAYYYIMIYYVYCTMYIVQYTIYMMYVQCTWYVVDSFIYHLVDASGIMCRFNGM